MGTTPSGAVAHMALIHWPPNQALLPHQTMLWVEYSSGARADVVEVSSSMVVIVPLYRCCPYHRRRVTA